MEAGAAGDAVLVDKAMKVAGLGCRQGVNAAEVLAAVDAALAAHGLGRVALAALATLPQKRGDTALAEAAQALGLRLLVAGEKESASALPRILTQSAASLAATGTGSASEAAALAAVGEGGRLLGPRLATGRVTCAIAEGSGRP